MELLLKAAVEVRQVLLPALLALFYVVQAVLHPRRELEVHDVREALLHEPGHDFAQARRAQVLALLHHVFVAEYRRYSRRVGGRAAYALFLHRADERRLRVPGGRLGELLLLVELHELRQVPLLEVGQGLFRGVGLVVALLLIDRGVAGKDQLGVVRAENVALAGGVHHDVIIYRVGHLAGHEAAPDQPVEHVLFLREVRAHHLGGKGGVRRPDRLVRVLSAGLGLVAAGLLGAICLAVVVLNEAARRGYRLVREPERVCSHVGYEAHGTHARHVHALVELLRDGHRPPRRHAQAAAGLLLQRGGYERGRGAALLLAALHALYRELFPGHRGDDGVRFSLAVELRPAAFRTVVPRGELAVPGAEHGVQQPIFLRHESSDLPLAVHDHPRRHGLHTARGQAAAYLLPQQRRELVAHYPVQDAPRLLRVHQVLIYLARRRDALRHHPLRYLVEGHAAGLAVRQVQQFLQVPGYRLALAVRVRCEIHRARLRRALAQVLDDLFLALHRDILRHKAARYVHAHRALGQVPQVAHRRHDLIALTQIFFDGPGLRRGFDYDQLRLCLCH